MTDHSHAPNRGLDLRAVLAMPGTPETVTFIDCQNPLAPVLHLTLEQHSAYVALEAMIGQYGVRPVLDNMALVCTVLGCSKEDWVEELGPVLVPLLDVEPEEMT